jgi:hypothetical protein
VTVTVEAEAITIRRAAGAAGRDVDAGADPAESEEGD